MVLSYQENGDSWMRRQELNASRFWRRHAQHNESLIKWAKKIKNEKKAALVFPTLKTRQTFFFFKLIVKRILKKNVG